MTAQGFIDQAYRKCGQMRPGYTVQPEQYAESLIEFQTMYDGYNAERTMSYSVPDYIYPIASNGLDGIYGENIQFTVGPRFTFTAALTITSTTALVANTTGLIIGQRISGTGIAAGSTIQGISINVSITLSLAATSTQAASVVTVTPDFIGPRPEAILRMNLWMTSASPTNPTRLPISPISAEEWANISVLAFTPINVANVFYYDPQYPQGVINVWPPLNGNSLEFFTWGFLTPPTLLSSTITVPPGYADLITYELAKRLWPMCTKQLAINRVSHQWLCGQAKIARDKVKAVNAPMPRMANDFGGGRGGGANVNDWSTILAGLPY